MSLPIFLSSCLTTFQGNFFQSGFSINDSDFKIIRTEKGKAQATYVFGIGGNKHEGLILEAKQDLYSKCKLEKNQQITNITTDSRNANLYPFFIRHTITISADIIEFFPRNNVSDNSIKVTEKIDSNQTKTAPVQEVKKVSEYEKFTDKMLTAMKNSKDLKVSQYTSIGEVAKGDYVRVSINISGYKQTIIGRVEGFSKKNNISIEIEPSPGVFMQEEHPFNYCEKIISW